MIKQAFIYIGLSLFLFSCLSHAKFEKTEELFSYIKEIQHINLKDDKQYLVIIANKSCNCVGDPLLLVPKFFRNDTLLKTIIIEKKDTLLYNIFTKIKNTNIYFDSIPSLFEYGLSNSTDYVFELENQKIVYWNYLSNNTDSVLSLRYLKE